MRKLISSFLLVSLALQTSVFAEQVVFNKKSLKYHKPGCAAAKKCTANCVKTDKKEAVKRGGKPCKTCGG